MYDRLVDSVLASVGTYPPEYKQSVMSEVSMHIDSINLPIRFQKKYMDDKSLPKHLKQLYNNFEDIIISDDSAYVKVADFGNTGYMIALLVEKILKQCLINDIHVPTMLYIDTNLLLENYGNVMDSNKGTGVAYRALIPEYIISSYIYNVDFVFWDKFDLSSLAYANRKLYEILSIRYNRCLNNMFFATSSPDVFVQKYSQELYNVMGLSGMYQVCEDDVDSIKYKGDNIE